jgi:hypothetical protein
LPSTNGGVLQLVKFNEDTAFQALEYWPDAYRARDAGVIVRRDVGYAEEGLSHRLGGIQSLSVCP